MSKRLVGWYNRQEFELVYKGLYSEDETVKLKAANHVSVWKSRMMQRLPSAIESTAELVIVMLNYSKVRTEGTLQLHDKQIRLQLSMAIIRFVNLLTDNRQVAVHALPVHMLANEIGLPLWLVELRHVAAHTNLPELSLLCKAANTALLWLEDIYWKKQIPLVPEKSCLEPFFTAEDVADFLDKYLVSRSAILEKTENATLRNLIKLFEEAFKHSRLLVIQTMCMDGFLIPTPEQRDLLGILEGHPAKVVPSKLIECWKPLLTIIDKCHCTLLLMSEIIHELSTADSWRNNWLTRWICTFSLSMSNSSERKRRNESPLEIKCKIDTWKLVEQLMMKPSIFTEILLNSFSSCDTRALSKEQYDDLIKLQNAFLEETDVTATKCNSPVDIEPKTVGMLNKELEDNFKDSDFKNNEEKTWKLKKEKDWSSFLLGCCQNRESLALPDYLNQRNVFSSTRELTDCSHQSYNSHISSYEDSELLQSKELLDDCSHSENAFYCSVYVNNIGLL